MRCCNIASNVLAVALLGVLSLSWTPYITARSINQLPSTKQRSTTLKPWDYHTDPNPSPSIESLEEMATAEDVDEVLDRVVGTVGGIIIQRYRPEPTWLWRQWFGTVLYSAWPRAFINMAWATAFCFFVRHRTHGDFNVWALEDMTDNPLVARFRIADKIWLTIMSLATFLLTFFVGQSYSFWRSFHDVGRSIQGRLNNIQMLLASHAARDGRTGEYTPEAREFLIQVAKQLRLFHILHWASYADRFRVLLTKKGWDGMVARGLVTEEDRDRLHRLDTPETQKQFAILQWMMASTQKAITDKKLIGIESVALPGTLMSEFMLLRSSAGTISSLIAGRMPLAYAHFVQILVDTFVVFTPIAKYTDLGIFSVLMIGILTFFYHGLLILALVFLDPLDNEEYCEGCVYLDIAVLIRESTAASKRWINGAAIMPE